MPRLKWSGPALTDIRRLHQFLATKNPEAANRAIKLIRQAVKELSTHPNVGRPTEDFPPEYRELIIPFGQSAYVALYRQEEKQVVIVAVRHGREAGY